MRIGRVCLKVNIRRRRRGWRRRGFRIGLIRGGRMERGLRGGRRLLLGAVLGGFGVGCWRFRVDHFSIFVSIFCESFWFLGAGIVFCGRFAHYCWLVGNLLQ